VTALDCKVLNLNIIVVYAEPLYRNVSSSDVKRHFPLDKGWQVADLQPPGILILQHPAEKARIHYEEKRLVVAIQGTDTPSSARLVHLLGEARDRISKLRMQAFGINLELEMTLAHTTRASAEVFRKLMPSFQDVAKQLKATKTLVIPSIILEVEGVRHTINIEIPDEDSPRFGVKSNAHHEIDRLPRAPLLTKLVDETPEFDRQVMEMLLRGKT